MANEKQINYKLLDAIRFGDLVALKTMLQGGAVFTSYNLKTSA
jgi:hypothetical protein